MAVSVVWSVFCVGLGGMRLGRLSFSFSCGVGVVCVCVLVWFVRVFLMVCACVLLVWFGRVCVFFV